MEQPPTGPASEPPPPPQLDPGPLWLSLLLPMGLAALFLGGMLLAGSGRQEDTIANLGVFVVPMAGIACWVVFAKCISKRYIGNTRVILIVLYPFFQSALVFAVFFAGCLLLLGKNGFH